MRIPLPDRLPPKVMFCFGAAIFVGQQLEGTSFVFSVLTVIYIGLWTAAFNVTGGIQYPSGAFIFFNGFLTVIGAVIAKALLFEAADGTLRSPIATMAVYCAAMAGMGVAAMLCRALRPAQPLLKGFETLEQMKVAAIVCLVLGLAFSFGGGSSQTSSGTLITAVRQINNFPLMAVLLATTYEVKRSNGTRSVNWIVLTSISIDIAFGLLYFTKEGMLIGPTAWLLAAALQRYNFSKTQLIGSALAFAFVVYYLVPYSQYVRVYSTTSKVENLAIAIKYLSNLNETRQLYLDTLDEYEISNEAHLFSARQSFLDRALIFAADDALVDFTLKGHVFGLQPTYAEWGNVVPRFIWHDKPSVNPGNRYAQELGWLPDDDETTGVSFSAAADTFHQGTTLALALILPALMFLAFIVSDSLTGSARQAPWAMLYILQLTHSAPEGGLGVTIYYCTYGVVGLFFLVFTLKTAAPFVLRVFRNKASQALADAPAQA